MKRTYVILCSLLLLPLLVPAQSWKAEAEAAIREHRMGDISIGVVDESGAFVEGATVNLRMREHAFKWGTNVRITHVIDLENDGFPVGSDHPYYNHLLNFNSVTPGNAGKWKFWLQGYIRNKYLEVMDWLNANDIQNRGHTTIWPSITRWNAVPGFVTNAQPLIDENGVLIKTREQVIRDTIRAHIEQQLPVLAARGVYELDLVNELVNEGEIVKNLLQLAPAERPAEHAQWYRWAKEAVPEIDLVANEYNLFQSGNNFHQRFVEYIQAMQANDAPIDVIGMQGHFFQPIPDYGELKRRLSEVAVMGLPMAVTEFDMNQNSYAPMERVLYAVFSEPLVQGFHLWGAWDGQHWRGNSPMYEDDWSLKESGRAWFDLVKNRWWTDTVAVSMGPEPFQFRAFLGEYDVYVEYEGNIFHQEFALGQEGTELRISIAEGGYPKPEAELLIEGDKTEIFLNEPLQLYITSESTVQSVTFYNGLQVLNRDDSFPFEYIFSVDQPATLELSAEVLFTNGYRLRTATETVAAIDDNSNPSILEIFPGLGATLLKDSGIELYVTASDPDNDPMRAILLDNEGNEVSRSDSLPFRLSLAGLQVGTNYLQLRVEDNRFGFDQLFLLYTLIEETGESPPEAPSGFSILRTGENAGTVSWALPVSSQIMAYKFFFEGEELPIVLREPEYDLSGLDPEREYTVQAQTIGRYTQLSQISAPFTFRLADAPITGIYSQQEGRALKVYPNPADGLIRVESRQPIRRLALFGLRGRLLRELGAKSAGTAAIDVSALPTGTYILRVWTDDGSVRYLQFIKQ